MQRLLPPKIQNRGQHSVFVSKDLRSCNHVFLRTDALRKGLQPPYESPFQVLEREEKVFKINKIGKELTVNIDRVKLAYVLRDSDSTRLPASESLTPQENLQEDRTSETPARTTRPETVTPLWTTSTFQSKICLISRCRWWGAKFPRCGGSPPARMDTPLRMKTK
ncbi:hypothetical protein AVEN_23322-1 [Araneus ventricosus]|uniref:Uncharacterized protein n=1 Tax=Araneus ventricosus TaxID=182803 RepID=A0A4Y2FX69_ARAVE|nr:hypothetical protein AVEN_23322-1 [Araneus ventricosus]